MFKSGSVLQSQLSQNEKIGFLQSYVYIYYLTVFISDNVGILILHCLQSCVQNFSEIGCWEVH